MAVHYEKLRGKKEVTNNKVKIPEKAKKIWMAVKKKKKEGKKNKPYNKAELWKCILWRNIIEL